MTLDDLLRPLYAVLRRTGIPASVFWHAARVVNTHFLMGVVGVIRNEAGEVLLFSHTYRRAPWGLPGGWMKGGETPLEALEREVREESGLRVKAERVLVIGVTRDRPKYEFIVAARVIGGQFTPTGEVSAMAWHGLDALPPIPRVQRRVLEALAIRTPEGADVYDTIWIGEGLAD